MISDYRKAVRGGDALNETRNINPHDGIVIALLVGLLLLWGTLAGCNESQRHRVLTFFFDGVPPLHPSSDEATSLQNLTPQAATTSDSTWTVHPPIEDCTQCHGQQRGKGFSGQVQLVTPVPALCDGCHTRPTADQGWVHGPVVKGECLFCHEPHRTQTPHLLRQPPPTLCFQCHDADAVRQVKYHQLPSYKNCLACHVGHVSHSRYLLRASGQGPGSLESAIRSAMTSYGQTEMKQAQQDWAAGKSLRELWNIVQSALQQQDRVQAQAYLNMMKTSGACPADANMLIDQIVTRLDAGSPPDPAAMQALDQRLAEQERQIAALYYRSINAMKEGRWSEAYQGLNTVLHSGVFPQAMRAYAQACLDSLVRRLQHPEGMPSGNP